MFRKITFTYIKKGVKREVEWSLGYWFTDF